MPSSFPSKSKSSSDRAQPTRRSEREKPISRPLAGRLNHGLLCNARTLGFASLSVVHDLGNQPTVFPWLRRALALPVLIAEGKRSTPFIRNRRSVRKPVSGQDFFDFGYSTCLGLCAVVDRQRSEFGLATLESGALRRRLSFDTRAMV